MIEWQLVASQPLHVTSSIQMAKPPDTRIYSTGVRSERSRPLGASNKTIPTRILLLVLYRAYRSSALAIVLVGGSQKANSVNDHLEW